MLSCSDTWSLSHDTMLLYIHIPLPPAHQRPTLLMYGAAAIVVPVHCLATLDIAHSSEHRQYVRHSRLFECSGVSYFPKTTDTLAVCDNVMI